MSKEFIDGKEYECEWGTTSNVRWMERSQVTCHYSNGSTSLIPEPCANGHYALYIASEKYTGWYCSCGKQLKPELIVIEEK